MDFYSTIQSDSKQAKYVEVEGEFIETPFQHFEEVLPEIAVAKLAAESPRQMARMASLEDARAAIKEGKNSAWGQLPESYAPFED